MAIEPRRIHIMTKLDKKFAAAKKESLVLRKKVLLLEREDLLTKYNKAKLSAKELSQHDKEIALTYVTMEEIIINRLEALANEVGDINILLREGNKSALIANGLKNKATQALSQLDGDNKDSAMYKARVKAMNIKANREVNKIIKNKNK